MGKLYVVGFGPGGYEHMTAKAIDVIEKADVVTGYTTYVNILKEYFPDKHYMVDLTGRLVAIKTPVDHEKYFTINRARQYGKTTTLRALSSYL